MSHWNKIKTKIKDLKPVLSKMIQNGWFIKPSKEVKGYFKDSTKTVSKNGIVMKHSNAVRQMDIGFDLNEDGSYSVIADDIMIDRKKYRTLFQSSERFEVYRIYCEEVFKEKMQEKGFSVESLSENSMQAKRMGEFSEEKVTMILDDDFNPSIHTEGFTGESCTRTTYELEDMLGKSSNFYYTLEAFEEREKIRKEDGMPFSPEICG